MPIAHPRLNKINNFREQRHLFFRIPLGKLFSTASARKIREMDETDFQCTLAGCLVGWLTGKGRVCTYVRTPAGIKCLNHHQAAHNGVCHHTCYPRHALLDASSNQTNTRIFIYTHTFAHTVYGVVAHCTLACSIYILACSPSAHGGHSFFSSWLRRRRRRDKIGCHLRRFFDGDAINREMVCLFEKKIAAPWVR